MKYGLPKLDLAKADSYELLYRNRIVGWLQVAKGNVSEAARLSGLSRASFYRRMHYLDVKIAKKGKRGSRLIRMPIGEAKAS